MNKDAGPGNSADISDATVDPHSASVSREPAESTSLALVIAWHSPSDAAQDERSAAGPESRVGEICHLRPRCRYILGRSKDSNTDEDRRQGYTRCFFYKQGPQLLAALGLDSVRSFSAPSKFARNRWPSISAQQLLLELTPDGNAISLQRVPSAARRVYVNGVQVEEARVVPGDTIRIGDVLLLLCVRRPLQHPAIPLFDESALGAAQQFGQPDADGIVGESQAVWKLRGELARLASLSAPRPVGEPRPSAAAAVDKHGLVTASPRMLELLRHATDLAQNERVRIIFLAGESGVGKDLLARVIHRLSSRREGPYLQQNTTALPDNLLDSELFGSDKGGFTGAESRPGLFERAHGGFLFLNEIGDASDEIQKKLLSVLEGKPFRRVGGTRDLQTDVRIIAATNADLKELVRAGRFRLDLYHRLTGQSLHIPPLRQRPEDIGLLVRHFLARQRSENDRAREAAPLLDGSAIQALEHYPWPGNIRQLEKYVESLWHSKPGRTLSARDLVLPEEEGVADVRRLLFSCCGILPAPLSGPLSRLLLACEVSSRQLDNGGRIQLTFKPRQLGAERGFALQLERSLVLPGLSEHPEDIPLLVSHLLGWLRREPSYRALQSSDDVPLSAGVEFMEFLLRRDYPSHVASLTQLLEAALPLSDRGKLVVTPMLAQEWGSLPSAQRDQTAKTEPTLPGPTSRSQAQGSGVAGRVIPLPSSAAATRLRGAPAMDSASEPRPEPGAEDVREAILTAGGNKKQAAEILRVSRRQLYNLIDRYGLRDLLRLRSASDEPDVDS